MFPSIFHLFFLSIHVLGAPRSDDIHGGEITKRDGEINQNTWINFSNGLFHFDANAQPHQVNVQSAGTAGYYNSVGGYPPGQCTGFVANILKDAGISSQYYENLGDATDWAQNARSKGLTVDFAPAVGSVISFHYDGVHYLTNFGHAAFITGVGPDSIEVAEGNFNSLPYHVRTISNSDISSSSNGIIHY